MLTAFGEAKGISGLERNNRAPTYAGKISNEHCRASCCLTLQKNTLCS